MHSYFCCIRFGLYRLFVTVGETRAVRTAKPQNVCHRSATTPMRAVTRVNDFERPETGSAASSCSLQGLGFAGTSARNPGLIPTPSLLPSKPPAHALKSPS